MDVHLNYINATHGKDVDVVIFQKGFTSDPDDPVFAWKVIQHCGFGCHHPFVYHSAIHLSIGDEYGNYSSFREVVSGQTWSVQTTHNGRRISQVGSQIRHRELQVRNDQSRGAINVCLFKDKRLLVRKTAVAPQQMVVFDINMHTLWLGAATDVVLARPLTSALVSDAHEFSVLGLASADIVMTGGGKRPIQNYLP